MIFDESTATPGEKRAVLLLAKMYDGGERSVNCEEFSELLGTRAAEFETLFRHISQANLIRHQSREGFSLTAMIMDAASRINAAPSLNMLNGLKNIAVRRKMILVLFLLVGAACCLLLLAAHNALREAPAVI